MHHDTCPRHIDAAIKGKQAWRRFKYHVRRHVKTHHRRHGNTHFAAFRGYARAPVINLGPVRITAQVDLPLLGTHNPSQRRACAVEVHRNLAWLHIKWHKVAVDIHSVQLHLTKQLRALQISRQPQISAEHPRRFFTTREDRVHHRKVNVADIHVTAQITLPLRIGNLHLTVELAVIRQTNQPAQLSAIVMQIGFQIQRVKRHRQRCVVHRLRDLHVTPGERHAALRQALFGGVPCHIGLTAEYAAGLRGLRHKRFQHRQIKAV
ncbi:hypothetical protein D3C80_889210 [compost metagenome]